LRGNAGADESPFLPGSRPALDIYDIARRILAANGSGAVASSIDRDVDGGDFDEEEPYA